MLDLTTETHDRGPRTSRYTDFWWLLVAGLLASVLARGIAFFSMGHSLDDIQFWPLPEFGFEGLWLQAAREGRFLFPVVAEFANLLGVNIPRSPTLSAFVMSTCLAVGGVAICHLWRVERDRFISTLVVCIFVAHPYFTDIFVWKMSMFTGGIPFAVSLFAMVLARCSWPKAILAAVMVFAALAIHQLPLGVCAGVWLVAVSFDMMRSGGRLNPDHISQSLRMAAALGFGTAIYFAVSKGLIAFIGMESVLNRDRLILQSHPGLVSRRTIELLQMMLYRDLLIPTPVRLALLAAIGLATIPNAARALWRKNWRYPAAVLTLPPALLATALLACALTVIPFAWVPSYRNLVGISVLWAAGIAVVAVSGVNGKVRQASGVLGALIVFSFVGTGNVILSDQLRQSERDRNLMTLIASRLVASPDYARAQELYIVGTNFDPLRNLSTGADISAGWGAYGTTFSSFSSFFGQDGYLFHLFREVTGSDRFAFTAAGQAKALTFCESAPTWPAWESVVIREGIAIVCLSPPASVVKGPLDVGS